MNARVFSLYGSGQTSNLIANMIQRVKTGEEITLAGGKGMFLTPFFVDDAVESFLKLMKMPLPNSRCVVNLAGDEVLSLFDVVSSISKVVGKAPVIDNTEENPKYLCGDNSRLKKYFGIDSFVSFEEGIRKTLSAQV